MRLSAPNGLMFLVSVILGGLAIVGHYMPIRIVSQYQFWLLVAAWSLLVFGCLFRISRA